MSVKTPSKTKKDRRKPSTPVRRLLFCRQKRLLPAVCLASALLAVLLRYGLSLAESLGWSLGFGVLLPLGLALPERAGARCRWAAFAAGPLLAFVLVEQMNYNYLIWEELSALQIGLNLVWYYMTAGLLYLATGRVRLTAGLTTGLFVFVGLANRYIIRFRGRTIFPGDLLSLRTAANVAGNYDYTPDVVQLRCLLVCALFLLLLWKVPKRPGRQRPRWKAALPLTALSAVYLVIFFRTDFLRWAEIEPSLWTTRGNGFVLNFSVCLRYSGVEEPEGYSQEALAAIQMETGEGWKGDPAAVGAETPVNLIVIMNESFSNLAEVFDLETNTDPLPFFHSLTENTIRGTAYSSVFGGTTANSEYEFLTGNTMAFLPEGTVPFHMYVGEEEPNLGSQLGSLGYRTVFLHPYLSSGWNRRAVYKSFGFDEIHFQGDFTDPAYMRNYITDQSNYEELIRRYEAKEEGESLFIFNVTMQNHSAYNVPWTGLDKTVWLTGDLEGRYSTVDQYLSLLRQSDSALEYLIGYFSQVEEPTMILFFGDHQPQVATNFYTEMLGGDFEKVDIATAQQRQEVPFFLWANYDIPEEDGVVTSLNYLSALLVETAGLPMTDYQRFLLQLQERVPALNAMGYMDTDGAWQTDRSALSETAQAWLLRYESLQYNLLFDSEEDRLPDFFTLPAQ